MEGWVGVGGWMRHRRTEKGFLTKATWNRRGMLWASLGVWDNGGTVEGVTSVC